MTHVEFIPVKSSLIKGIGHAQETMYVKFWNKKLYSYYPVTKEKFQEFKDSESKGKYFTANFKTDPSLKIQHENIEIK